MAEPTRDDLRVRVEHPMHSGGKGERYRRPKHEELEPIHRAWLREKVGLDSAELRKALERYPTTDPWGRQLLHRAARALLDLLGEDTDDE